MLPTDPLLAAALARAGLAHRAEALAPFARDEVRVRAIPATPGDLAVGRSRIGGAPDLPPDTPWPRHTWTPAEVAAWPDYARDELSEAFAAGHVTVETREDGAECIAMPLPFIAQIALADLAPHDPAGRLPSTGHLWFFASQSTQLPEPGPGGATAVASAVLYANHHASSLVRTPLPPLPDGDILAPAAVAFERAVSLAAIDGAPPDAFAGSLDRGQHARLSALVRACEQRSPRHALLHAPDHGANGFLPPPGWTALLRVDSDDKLGWNFGDAAWIVFALPDEALAARRFDAARAFAWIG